MENRYCRMCGSQMPGDSLYCPKCGVRVATADTSRYSQNYSSGSSAPYNSGSSFSGSGFSKPKKKSGKGIWILLLIAVIGIYFYKNNSTGTTPVKTSGSGTSATVTPTPAPSLKPKYVGNGTVLINPSYERVCPLEIKASSDTNYYIRLEYKRAPSYTTESRTLRSNVKAPYETDIAFYVKAGSSVEIDVPIGVYKLYYATGDTFYGTKDLFGSDTRCYTSDELLDFYSDSQYYQGHTLTLYAVSNGNFDTDSISMNSFPTD